MPNTTPLVNFERWSRACIDIGVAPDEADYRRVRRAWNGMGRHYHTLTHLEACLREFDDSRSLAMRPAEVELGLWFHDSVYRGWRGDTALVVDVDLAILGKPPEVYAQFERAIRREYWWVPRARYVAARSAVLQKFLGRAAIYQLDPFHDKYERQARLNIAAAIHQLQWK